MKILVCSDLHGYKNKFHTVLEREKDTDYCFFLGDGIREAEDLESLYPEIKFIFVRGNCDYYSLNDTVAYKHIGGVTFMACHGHEFDVKRELITLSERAAAVKADIALYGHTHIQKTYEDTRTGVVTHNPGALCQGQYSIIIADKGKFDIKGKII